MPPVSASESYSLTRSLLIRGLGFIYGVVFLILFDQAPLLWGRQGLLPMTIYNQWFLQMSKGEWTAFWQAPSLFYFFEPDKIFTVVSLLGMLGGLLMMAGVANALLLMALWFLQLSFVNSGQLFYGYGWEILLLEVTVLCSFLVPLWNVRWSTSSYSPPTVVIWALRWTLFRLMLGAGLIKIRGDSCWTDLSCLVYHYETQPNPHPLSYFFHHLPELVQQVSVLFNHLVELVAPFGLFGPRRVRYASGVIMALFQGLLILSGNLAWFNWLTLVLCLSAFDDAFFQRWGLFGAGAGLHKSMNVRPLGQRLLLVGFAMAVAFFSYNPIVNLFSPQQAMNTSYNQWHLINSYGAFGAIGKERFGIVVAGSDDGVQWKEYQFPCATDSAAKQPCLITPYHLHLDWQMWFSAMRPQIQEEWLLRLAIRLLENNEEVKRAFTLNPFADSAPRWIKMDLYRYRFAAWQEWPEAWWNREWVRTYLPPIHLQNPDVQAYRSKE